MSKAQDFLSALGGAENIVELEPCITRLRVQVTDPTQVNDEELKAKGAFGVVHSGRIVQVVVGPEADELAEKMQELR